jgi:dTDP-4-amino-4,6-dideoxygalactose transaminase
MAGPGSYWIGEEERREIEEVLESGYLSRYGDFSDPAFKHKVWSLEQEVAKYCGTAHALATSSGTGSLLIAMLAAGLKPGDEVIVPAYTFVATYSAAIFIGVVPVLAEIDESLNLDPSGIEAHITPRTRAIMPVHMLGNPCDMDAIMAVAQKQGLMIIEDGCQAIGASYKGRKVGTFGRVGAFSLNVYKTITAGDGGLLVTDEEELYQRAFGIHDQGHKPLRAGLEVGKRSILGLNFRVNELVGAVALAQLRKLDRITATLRANKRILKQALHGIEGVGFRRLHDAAGECGTLCTVIFDSAGHAARVSAKLKTKTVDQSGWHVYANMEHVNRHLSEIGQPHGKGAYPRTDDILSRAINLSVGVVDAGLGSAFGININSTEAEIHAAADQFRKACLMA